MRVSLIVTMLSIVSGMVFLAMPAPTFADSAVWRNHAPSTSGGFLADTFPPELQAANNALISYALTNDRDILAQAQTQPRVAQAETPTGQVLIINQVRGRECCDQGSVVNLERQLDTLEELRLPAVLAVRWDALGDREMVGLLRQAKNRSPDLITLGLLVEVTPGLAEAAKVEYTGTTENWFEAQHAFTIGYQPEERRRLVDTLAAEFATVFGTSPRMSASWMIDTPTLNYLHQRHGIQLHQITREQWATDSYTLIGGPPHYPYPPSAEWLFVPDFTQPRQLLIARQTITDPLLNYGDTSNSFTSQPNDYSLGGRDLEYFQYLLLNALDQSGQTLSRDSYQPAQAAYQTNQPGFALIGLENSMAEEFQTEFVRQLEVVGELRDQNRAVLPSLDELHQTWQTPGIRVYASAPADNSSANPTVNPADQFAWWITTPNYRVRLRSDGRQLAITDLRLYDIEYTDPYAQSPAVNKGYWIVPYLIDGSRYYRRSLPEPGLLTKWFGPPIIPQLSPQPQQDLDLPTTSQLKLPPLQSIESLRVGRDPNSLTFEYLSQNQPVTLTFKLDSFQLDTTKLPEAEAETEPEPRLFTPDSHPVIIRQQDAGSGQANSGTTTLLQWQLPDSTFSHGLVMKCDSGRCTSSFTTSHQALRTARQQQYPFIFPEQRPRQLSADHTILYVHNAYAVAGRNPVRLVVVPYDTHGFFTSLAEPPRLTTQPEVAVTTDPASNQLDQVQLFDLAHPTPLAATVEIRLAGEVKSSEMRTDEGVSGGASSGEADPREREPEETTLEELGSGKTLPSQLVSGKTPPAVTKRQRVFFAPNCKQRPLHCLTHPRQAWWYARAIVGDKFRATVLEESQ